jgi:alpha-L-fucosidase
MEYDFDGYWKLVRQLQPKAVMFSDVGPDVRWVGNEAGNAGETCWSTITTDGMAPGKADPKYLNTVIQMENCGYLPKLMFLFVRAGFIILQKMIR